jgi:hypothetical protein
MPSNNIIIFDDLFTKIVFGIKKAIFWLGIISVFFVQPYALVNQHKFFFANIYRFESVSILLCFFVASSWHYLKNKYKWKVAIANKDNVAGINFAFVFFSIVMLSTYVFILKEFLITGRLSISSADPIPKNDFESFGYFFLPASITLTPLLVYWRIFDFFVYFDKTHFISLALLLASSLIALLPSPYISIIWLVFISSGLITPYIRLDK